MPCALTKSDTPMTDQEIIDLIARVARGGESEEQTSRLLDTLDREFGVPSGYCSDLIFWPMRHGLGDDPPPEQILAKARAYRPLLL